MSRRAFARTMRRNTRATAIEVFLQLFKTREPARSLAPTGGAAAPRCSCGAHRESGLRVRDDLRPPTFDMAGRRNPFMLSDFRQRLSGDGPGQTDFGIR